MAVDRQPKKTWLGLEPAQASSLLGIVAAMVLAVLANVLVSRHYTRWDWTGGQRYTLTPATLDTLHGLSEPVELWVLVGGGDPLEQSIKQILVSYEAETPKLDVHWIDPDRDTVALEDVRKRFRVETARTQEGRVVADAIMVVAQGDRHWFLLPSDMFEVEEGHEARAKPREEQAITGAIRNVVGGKRVRLCFTAGHGEPSLEDGSKEGLGLFRDILEKDNFETVTVDTTAPNARTPFDGCGVVVVGARAPFSKDEDERLRTWLLGGGSALFAVGPSNADTDTGMEPSGLSRSLAPFGIALDDALVFETDPSFVLQGWRGIRFVATAKSHPVSQALFGERNVPKAVLHFARPLRRSSEPGASVPVDLLVTTDKAFGVVDIHGAARWTGVPDKRDKDLAGPLVVAMASERPKVRPDDAHGPRVVVVGTSDVLAARWLEEPTPVRGGPLLVESALSWLSSKPQVLDIPPRPSVAAGIRISEDSRDQVRRYVLYYMPGAALALGVLVAWGRRRSEGSRRERPDDDREAARNKKKRKPAEADDADVEDSKPEDESDAGDESEEEDDA
jgi:hypothetical protein